MMVLKIAAVLLVLAVGAVLALAATRPDHFRVERSALVAAPPEKIFPHIDRFDRWRAWSPYEKKDPGMKRSLSGPAAGKGAALLSRVLGLFIDMDRMIGRDFEDGLASLKALAER